MYTCACGCVCVFDTCRVSVYVHVRLVEYIGFDSTTVRL